MGYRFIISHNHTNPENLMLRLTHTHHCSPIQIDLGFRNFEKLWRGGGDCSVCVCVWGGGVPEDMEMKLCGLDVVVSANLGGVSGFLEIWGWRSK